MPWGSKLLVVGNFNADLANTEEADQDKEIAAYLVEARLEYILVHFLPRQRPWCQYGREWSMVCQERKVRYRTDYILRTDCHLSRYMSVQDPRHNSDHYMILG